MFFFKRNNRWLDWVELPSRDMDWAAWYAEYTADDGREFACGVDIWHWNEGQASVCEKLPADYDGDMEDVFEWHGELGRKIATTYEQVGASFDTLATWCEEQLKACL